MSTGYKIVEQNEIHFPTFQIVKWIHGNYAGLPCVLEICVVPLGMESSPLMRSIR
jgi:hypothetical protein